MVAPKWVLNEVQPIAIRDMLEYLCQALDKGPLGVIEVGAEPRAFLDMMKGYARIRGYRRYIIPVPVLAPGLAALWVGLVTPITNRLAVPLVRGVIRPLYADTTGARKHFPSIQPVPYETAVERAMAKTAEGNVETRWSGALGDSATSTYASKDWEAVPEGNGTRLVQTAMFTPHGLPGLLYWYALYPIHRLMFSGLARAVARDAESQALR